LASSRGAGALNSVHPTVEMEDEEETTTSEFGNDADVGDGQVMGMVKLVSSNTRGDSEIGSDIFDDSLRYSNVDRPTLNIERSSALERRRGSFLTEEERIARIFTPKGQDTPWATTS